MTDIYTAFDKSVPLTAVAILRDGKPVGRIVIKFGSAATAYVQIWGYAMVRGRATGGGYDRATAAVIDAVRRIETIDQNTGKTRKTALDVTDAFANGRDGTDWTRTLEDAGFVLARVA